MDSKKKYEELVADGEINNLPKWFRGEVYAKGGEVTNPFSGGTYYLNAQELSMYDFIKGAEHFFALYQETQPNPYPKKDLDKLISEFEKGLSWFRTKNSEAYMVLLD